LHRPLIALKGLSVTARDGATLGERQGFADAAAAGFRAAIGAS